MYYVIGLGNPDEAYSGTRHNVGRSLVQLFAARYDFPEWNYEKNACSLVTRGEIQEKPAVLYIPETFMNRSGEAAAYIREKCGADTRKIIVVFDDINLPIGSLRISFNRGDGGHNGIKSIIAALKTKEFIQVRIGIAPVSFWTGAVRRPEGSSVSAFVLGRFSRGEHAKLENVQQNVCEALVTIISEGVERAMNIYNAQR